MFVYIIRRILMLFPILILMSMVAFFLIQLPPGDYVSFRITQMKMSGVELTQSDADLLYREFGLDQPAPVRYFRWVSNIVTRGYWGRSLQWNKPVHEILKDYVPQTVMISVMALIVSWAIAIPLGVISATRQYSMLDYIITFIGFVGIATPGFLLALILAYLMFSTTGFSPLGLFSTEYMDADWSWARLGDLGKHLILPLIIIGMANTGGTIRVVRNNLLDELHKQYVITARAKGLTEWKLLMKYPVRMAINPLLSSIGWVLPGLISGTILLDIVLSLQTIGPVLLRATLAQDMYLAGSIVLILSALTVIGGLIGDIALAAADPRIRFGSTSR